MASVGAGVSHGEPLQPGRENPDLPKGEEGEQGLLMGFYGIASSNCVEVLTIQMHRRQPRGPLGSTMGARQHHFISWEVKVGSSSSSPYGPCIEYCPPLWNSWIIFAI